MKSILVSLMFIAFPFFVVGQGLMDKIDFGGGIVIGTNSDINDLLNRTDIGLGLQGRINYTLTENITIAPNYTYYFTTPPDGVNFSLSQVNLNGQIYLAYSETTGLYMLAGASYVKSERSSDAVVGSTSDDAYGLNLGLGLNRYNNGYLELKYDSALGQFQLGAGYLFFRKPKIMPK